MKPEAKDKGRKPATSADVLWSAIEWDRRVGWRDHGADRYLYRPDQLLVGARYEERLAPHLEEAGARRTRLRCTEGRLLESLGVRRWTLVGQNRNAPEAVDVLRERLDDLPPEEQAQAVTVNHVLGGAPVYRFGPGGLPSPGGPGAVQPERSKTRGTGKGVQVAILDTGFVTSSTAHSLLARDYADDGDDRDQLYDEGLASFLSVVGGHGTFIAGIIRQRAPETVLDPEVTLDDVLLVDEVELAQDVLRVRTAGIVNLSLAGPSEADRPPMALARALEWLRQRSKGVYVAAAGNDYELAVEANVPHQRMWPAAFGELRGFDHVVGVAAVDREHRPAGFSNRGPWVRACAYGVEERSTFLTGTMPTPGGPLSFPHATARWSGTSFAAPRVVGAIAATMTAGGRSLSPRAALKELLAGAPDGPPHFGKFVD